MQEGQTVERSEAITENPWRKARDYVIERHAAGEVSFKTNDLRGMCGCPKAPAFKAGESASEYRQRLQEIDMAFMGYMVKMKSELLEIHKIDLRSSGKGGTYRIVPPGEQVEKAVKDTRNAIRKACADGSFRVEHVDTSALDGVQLKARTDAGAHLDSLARLAGGRR